MRKDLTCTKVLEIIMQPDPSSELQYVLSQTTDYNRCKGSVENSTQGMCHYCTGERDSVSCSCPSRHKSTDTSRHQQLRSEKGNMQVVQRTKKRTLSSCICCGGHTCKEHQVICCKSCWKDWTYTHTHTHTHTHTILTLNT